eukprot:s153_g55.t1
MESEPVLGTDGGAIGTAAIEVSTLSEDEMLDEMEEPPNGDTPQSFTQKPGPKRKSEVQDEFKPARDFSGMTLEDLYMIEICAGSARLSKVAHDNGFRTMPIDHSTARTCGFPICVFDLTDADDLAHLVQFIEESADSILAVWIAPSCGTCSRAREKRLTSLEAAGFKVPVPLRSTAQPDQLDGLAGLDKIKVEKANMLYDSVYVLASLICALHIFLAIENPTNSHYWGTSPMQRLCNEQEHHYVTFHNCAHGGSRDKSTSLWVNDDWLDSLALLCDKQHSHKPWTTTLRNGSVKFATSEEAAYPMLLCERVVHCFKDRALSFGASEPQTLSEQAAGPSNTSLSRIVLGALPRGYRAKPVVAEYGSYLTVYADPQRDSELQTLISTLPKGAKLIARRLVKRGEIQAAESGAIFLDTGESETVEKIHIGVPSEPDEFIQRAIAAGHPRSLDQHVDPQIRDMIHSNFVEEPANLAKKRVAFFHKYLKRATELSAMEDEMRSQMPEHVRQLVGNKRLVLWREILNDHGYPDTTLIDEMAQGFKLSGWMSRSNVFKARTKRPAMSLTTLRGLAKALNSTTYKNMAVRQDPELEAATWAETEEEASKGWIWFDEDSDGAQCKFIGRRFGIQQSNKTRVIDDCSCCGLNWTVGLHEKFQLQSIDILASIISEAFKASGERQFPSVFGRCYDLKSAYKQFAVHPLDREHLRMAVRSPVDEAVKLIGFNALPFGAVGSVSGFLRVSLAVWFIGVVALHLCWTAFYDDFGVLSRSELLGNTSWCVESLFQLLGLRYATEGKKFLPFDQKFKMLGLEVDLSQCHNKDVLFGHTEERRAELISKIDDILAEGWLDSKEAERLRGRMIFYEGYTFGRIANSAIKNLGRFCTEKGGRKKLDPSISGSLLALRDRVLNSAPISVSRPLTDTWIIFTDGACNPDLRQGSVGGLILSPHGQCLSYFSEVVPFDILSEFFNVSCNPIHELEVLPVLIACLLWGKDFSKSLVVYYIDNESARMAYVKGCGETTFASAMIGDFVSLECEFQHRTWFGRCPSFSNPADGASRLDLSWFEGKGAHRTTVEWERLKHRLGLEGEQPDRR